MNMIASVLELNRSDIQALRVTDTYSLHRVVYSLFEDIRTHEQKLDSAKSGILFSDSGTVDDTRRILMLSNRQPADTVNGHKVSVRSCSIDDHYLSHKTYAFNVVVNPVKSVGEARKKIAIRGKESIEKWFIERAEKSWGFSVVTGSLQINKVVVDQFNGKDNQPITLSKAHIKGSLLVTDPSQFAKSFGQGIGRGKAFGCGLMQVTPVIQSPFNN